MDELKPCPFCGSTEIEYKPMHFGGGESHGVMRCLECGCTVPTSEFGKRVKESYSEWNRRAGEPDVRARGKSVDEFETIKMAADAMLEESRAFGKAMEEFSRFLLAKDV